MPPGCAAIRRSIDQLRRQLEDACVAAHGEIGIVAAAQIQTAIRWERHAMLAQRWLRLNADALEPTERLKYSSDIARASSERDKVISALNLNARRDEFNPAEQLRARAALSRSQRLERVEQVSDVMFVQ
ncbi:MAG TPA: hypothetical protein VNQ76_01925, partial [Planctomicrobium sp.]|nr:hypothetical protein [Planctomicrobium sp.]